MVFIHYKERRSDSVVCEDHVFVIVYTVSFPYHQLFEQMCPVLVDHDISTMWRTYRIKTWRW